MRCKRCKDKFEPRKFLQKFCMEKDECISEFLKEMRAKNAKQEKNDWQLKKKVLIEKTMTHSDWLKRLETEINKICRIIDYGQNCISCGGNGKPQAGHYHSVGSDSTLRFNLHNIHIQDYFCNVQMSANIIGYDEGLIKTYGLDYWNYIKFGLKNLYHNPSKLSIDEIKNCIELSRLIIKTIEKTEKELNPKERIELRDSINQTLGIYKHNYLK